MKILTVLSVCFLFCQCKQGSQDTIFPSEPTPIEINEVQQKLALILKRDQGIRKLMQPNLTEQQRHHIYDSMNLLYKLDEDIYELMVEIDSVNLIAVEDIINKYGIPSKNTFGKKTTDAVYYVIQHSDKIAEYLPAFRKSTTTNGIDSIQLAMMEDRNLMYLGKPQLYGTQIKGTPNKDGSYTYFVWPVQHPDSLNNLRASIGLEPIEEYAKRFDITYSIVDMEDIEGLDHKKK